MRQMQMGSGRLQPAGAHPESFIIDDGVALLPYDKQVAGVLRVDLPVSSQGSGSICGAKRELLEDLLLERSSLTDRKQITIFAIGKDDSVRVNHSRVDAPFEAVRVIGNACYRAIRIS